VISTTAHGLRLEKQLVDAADTLAEDNGASLKISEDHPVPGFTRIKLAKDGETFQRDFDAVGATPSSWNVRDCPHT
jgi:hypothetical protein